MDGGLTDQAREIFIRVAGVFAAAGRSFDLAAVETNLALLASRSGDLDDALARYREALALLEGIAEQGGTQQPDSGEVDLREANIRVNLGVLQRRRSDLSAAGQEYRRAQELYLRLGRAADAIELEVNLAVLDERAGHLQQARERLEQLRLNADNNLDELVRAQSATTLATVAAQQGRFEEAARLLDEAATVYLDRGLPRALAEVLTNQG